MTMIHMHPVALWDRSGTRRVLADVEAAALFMLYQWPQRSRSGQLRLAAQIAALAAMEGSGAGTAEEFRTALIAAAAEADILAPLPERPGTEWQIERWSFDVGDRRRSDER
ncbi:DUF982 domain-containing protein [Starkeya sp. ORNL1]|nr:DUF982 domain-containing protein [Starkeya sp. ORNL1]